MATKTSLLKLTKPAYTDAADVAVLNANFDLIDNAIGNTARARNELDNSDFMPGYVINQRGATTVTNDNNFIVDRWRFSKQLTDSDSSVSLGDGGITMTAGADSYTDIYQKFENYAAMEGKAYTVGVCVGGEWQVGAVDKMGSCTPVNLPCGIRIHSIASRHLILRLLAGKSPVTVQRVALYEGSYTAETFPAYVYKGFAQELSECRRYYENSWYPGTRDDRCQYNALNSVAKIDAFVQFKQTKRVTPTVTLYPYSTRTAWQYYNGAYFTASAEATEARMGNNGILVRLTKAATDTTTLVLQGAYIAEGHWAANAEL